MNKLEVFNSWLLKNGSTFSNLEVKEYDVDSRGCYTTCRIVKDEVIISIPLKCLISVEMGMNTAIGKKIMEAELTFEAQKHVFLMIFILVDMLEENSFFRPYYDILPSSLSNMPIFWSNEELDMLQGSQLVTQIDERNLNILADYNSICSTVPEFASICSVDKFKWARMIVCSRNFGVTCNGSKTAVLVPYADMLNHKRPRETSWQFDDSTQCFTVIALEDLQSGIEVYDSYGLKSNHRFLLNYGFSVERNIESDGSCPNEVPVLLELSRSDPIYDEKFRLYWIKESPSSFKRIRVSMNNNEGFKTMLACIRIIVANVDEFYHVFPKPQPGVNYHRGVFGILQCAIGIDNERKVMLHLKNLCEEALRLYSNSYEVNCALLTETFEEGDIRENRLVNPSRLKLEPFSNARNAIIQIVGEQEVLHYYLHFADTVLSLLNYSLPESACDNDGVVLVPETTVFRRSSLDPKSVKYRTLAEIDNQITLIERNDTYRLLTWYCKFHVYRLKSNEFTD